jgi:hypothetical protein
MKRAIKTELYPMVFGQYKPHTRLVHQIDMELILLQPLRWYLLTVSIYDQKTVIVGIVHVNHLGWGYKLYVIQ